MKAHSIGLVLTIFLTACVATAQDSTPNGGTTIVLPDLEFVPVTAEVSVPDGGAFVSGSIVHRPVVEPVRPWFFKEYDGPAIQVISALKTEELTFYEVTHGGRNLNVRVFDTGKIEIGMIRLYTEENMDELEEAHPDLMMHVRAFPRTSNGNAKFRLSIEAETTLSFENADELASRHPDLKAVFDRCREHQPVIITVTPRIIIQEEEPELIIIRD